MARFKDVVDAKVRQVHARANREAELKNYLEAIVESAQTDAAANQGEVRFVAPPMIADEAVHATVQIIFPADLDLLPETIRVSMSEQDGAHLLQAEGVPVTAIHSPDEGAHVLFAAVMPRPA